MTKIKKILEWIFLMIFFLLYLTIDLNFIFDYLEKFAVFRAIEDLVVITIILLQYLADSLLVVICFIKDLYPMETWLNEILDNVLFGSCRYVIQIDVLKTTVCTIRYYYLILFILVTVLIFSEPEKK